MAKNINGIITEAKGLGNLMRKHPGSCGREHYERLSYLRTKILIHNMDQERRKLNVK